MKRLRLMLMVASSMLFRPTHWEVSHNVPWWWEIKHCIMPIMFCAHRDQDKKEWYEFELRSSQNEMLLVALFCCKFLWLWLARWVNYRNEAKWSRINGEELFNVIKQKQAKIKY